jgi:hypothetical protein
MEGLRVAGLGKHHGIIRKISIVIIVGNSIHMMRLNLLAICIVF